MQCPEIKGLSFDQSSVDAINQIKAIQQLGTMLTALIGTSVMVEIFAGNGGIKKPSSAAWGISQYDWFQWSQAMVSVPSFVRHRVRMIAFEEYNKHHSGNEHEFWRAVMNGCGY
ncbi:MAG: hypothetical protein AABY83_14520 [Pseudomonadota bacterium]